MEISFLAGVSFRRDLNLLIWQPRGVLDEPHMEQIIATLEAVEDEADRPFNRYTDLSKLTVVDVTFDYVFRVSLYRRALYMTRPPVKSAMFVVERTAAELALTHAKVTAESPLQVQVFLRISAAARWLDVLVSDLAVER